MAPTRHVLVLEKRPAHASAARSAPKDAGVMARVVHTISDALRELKEAGYDAVFLRVEGPEELAFVLRIKSAVPDVPVCALVPDLNQDLERLARDSGADEVLPSIKHPDRDAGTMDRVLASTEGLIRRSQALIARGTLLRNRFQELSTRSRALSVVSFDLAQVPTEDLVPLLVEDDADHAFFMKRSFLKLKLPFALPHRKRRRGPPVPERKGKVSRPLQIPHADAGDPGSASAPDRRHGGAPLDSIPARPVQAASTRWTSSRNRWPPAGASSTSRTSGGRNIEPAS